MEEHNSPSDEHLLLYILNEANDQESREIEEWINRNDSNKAYFHSFYSCHLDLICSSAPQHIQGNFKTFRKKMYPYRRLVRLYAGIAASLCLFIASGLWLFLQIDSPSGQNPAETALTVGTTKAILYLTENDSVSVASDNQALLEQYGIQIDERQNIMYQNPMLDSQKEVRFHKLVVPRGGDFMLRLNDGTKVWLNSESEFIYPVKFAGNERTVKMKGEAYFEVAHNPSSPFIVQIENIKVKVYGTSFNINQHKTGIIETVLVKGSVGIEVNGLVNMLQPEQKADYIETEDKLVVSRVNVFPYIAWKEGRFYFDGERLESIMNTLTRWYDINIIYEQSDLKDVVLSGNLKREDDINKLLRTFERIAPIRIISEGHIVRIMRK